MATSNESMSPKEIEEAFIKITFEEDTQSVGATDPFHDPWVSQGELCSSECKRVHVHSTVPAASNRFSEPTTFGFVLRNGSRLWFGLNVIQNPATPQAVP